MTKRLFLAVALLISSKGLLLAAGTDAWANRTLLSGAVVSSTGNNVNYTTEANENTLGGLYGATAWWKWTAPATGWVMVDTYGSSSTIYGGDMDTVLAVFTGTTLANQILIGFNDEDPLASYTSMLNFYATAGATYNIAVGGWIDSTNIDQGTISLHLAQNAAAVPDLVPAILSFAPTNPNVTAGPTAVTATYSLTGLATTGTVDVSFRRPDGQSIFPIPTSVSRFDTTAVPPVFPPINFSLPQYSVPGTWQVVFTITPDDPSLPIFDFGSSVTGFAYVLPPSSAVAKTITVVNTGAADPDAPEVTAITVTPRTLDVTGEQKTIEVTATITDDLAGVDTVIAYIDHPTLYISSDIALELVSGSLTNGSWSGTIVVPRNFPSATYNFVVIVGDKALNTRRYSPSFFDELLPGGDITIPVTGGGAFHAWLFENFGNDLATEPLESNNDANVSNLFCYAFNLDIFSPTTGPGTLPEVALTSATPDGKLHITFLRRTAAGTGLAYSPEFASNPDGAWSAGVIINVEAINDDWERVTVEDLASVGTEPRRFGRVKVTYTAP